LALIIYGLALLALVVMILMFPQDVARAIESLTRFGSLERGLVTFVLAVLILLALFLALRQPRLYSKDGLMVKASGALTDVSVESARERILKAIRKVPNVVSADARLRSIDGKADIEMDIGVVGSDVNVPDKQREIDRTLRQVMLKQLGLQLAAAPRVHIQLLSERDIDVQHEDVARPFAPPLVTRKEPEAPVREETVAVQYTPPSDAPSPAPSRLEQEPPESGPVWTRVAQPEPDSEREPVVEVVEETLREEARAGDEAMEQPVEVMEPAGEETDGPPIILGGPSANEESMVEEVDEERPGQTAPDLRDIDPDYDEPAGEDSSETRTTGLYGVEGDQDNGTDSTRRSPSLSDLE